MSLPSRADLFAIGAEDVIARSLARPPSQRISREAIYTEGSDINLILGSNATMATEVLRLQAERCAAMHLDSAEGDDLDRLVYDRFGDDLVRKQPSKAVVPLEFSRPNPSGGVVSLSIGTRVRTAAGTVFELTQALAIPAGSTAPVIINAQAITSGSSGNVAAGTVVQFVQSPPDPALLVTNTEPAAGGDDVENDGSLRRRARLFYKAARRGVLAAIEFGALAIAGIRTATGIELTDSAGDPIGIVQLFIADVNGQANQAFTTAVRAQLLEYRAAGIVVDVFGATPRFEDIVYRLRFERGVNTAAAFEEVRFLATLFVNTLAPNKILETSLLMEIARKVPGVIVLQDALVEPVGDVVPNLGEVIKTRADLISVEFA